MRYQTRVQTHELEKHHCPWPIDGAVTVFCGANKVDDLPYCALHSRMAYQPAGATRSRAEVETAFRRWARMRKTRAA
jgi:hypothetical protein